MPPLLFVLYIIKIKSLVCNERCKKSAFINKGKTCENRWFMMLEKTMEKKMFTANVRWLPYVHCWVRLPKEKLTPNILRKSGSLKRKGIFDTWSRLGVLSALFWCCAAVASDCTTLWLWESVWVTQGFGWDCCCAAAATAAVAAAAAAREVATSWEPSSPCKKIE